MRIKSINFGADIDVCGKLHIVSKLSDLSGIQKGEIVYLDFSGDLLTHVVRCIDKGAAGFMAGWGRTNHGIIAAKELNVPAYYCDRKHLHNGKVYTLSNGFIYQNRRSLKTKQVRLSHVKTRKSIFINLGFPNGTFEANPGIPEVVDGVGFARTEFVILSIIRDLHPVEYLLKYGPDKFSESIFAEFSYALDKFPGKRFWIRTDDFSPNQLYRLKNGHKYESDAVDELVSFRGIARAIDPQWSDLGNFSSKLRGIGWFGLQLDAVHKLMLKFPKVRIGLFPPMVHDVSEYRIWRKLAEKKLGKRIDYGVMVEVPAIAGKGILPFIKEKLIKFVIFGSNDLTALTMGLNRSDARFSALFNEENPAVLNSMIRTIGICRKSGVLTAIGGVAASKPTLMKKLYAAGLDIFSVSPNPDIVSASRRTLYSLENHHRTKE